MALARFTKLVDNYLSAGDKEYDVCGSLSLEDREVPEFDERDQDNSAEQIRDLSDEVVRLNNELDAVISRSIERNSMYEREAAEYREAVSELVSTVAQQAQVIDSQYNDLDELQERAVTKIQRSRDRIFYLHQLLTAIGAYDGESADMPRNLARTALEEVVDDEFVWPDEQE